MGFKSKINFVLFFSITLLVIFSLIYMVSGVSFMWDPSTSPDVTGYKIYYGTTSGNYYTNYDVGNVMTNTVNGLNPQTTYYFAVKAYTSLGLESDLSNEVNYTIPINSGPYITLFSPTAGTNLPSGTTSTVLSVTTDVNSNCKWSSTAGTSYFSMSNSFDNPNSKSHSYTVTGLQNGNTYYYFVKCQDSSNPSVTSKFDTQISFNVDVGNIGTLDAQSGTVGWRKNYFNGTGDRLTDFIAIESDYIDISLKSDLEQQANGFSWRIEGSKDLKNWHNVTITGDKSYKFIDNEYDVDAANNPQSFYIFYRFETTVDDNMNYRLVTVTPTGFSLSGN